ncbi:hypothetical protein DN387_14010 [Pseudomonas sp. FBF18]|uniref:hypothetical protein n=1 Tax=Pseudomonas TaxID=286 RepID=UPI0006D3D40C|nr:MULTISPECIES: hypothetical protein [Pseudomonas]MCP8349354.1 hypothetical protein [Pseudomonas sp. FBF18]
MTTDKVDLKALAAACDGHQPLRYMRSHGALYIRNDSGIVFDVHQNRSFPDLMAQNKDYADLALACTPSTILGLLAEIDRMEREQKSDLIAYKAAIERQNELRAERDQLSKELESHKRMLLAAACDIGAIGEALGADMDDDGSAIEGLAQEMAKDAERLDFLESLARSSYTGASIVKGESKKSLEVMWFHKRAGAQPSLREAIDAAQNTKEAQ